MISAKKIWCNICKMEHYENQHEKNVLKELYNKIVRYEELGFSSDYIHIAIKEYLKQNQ